MAGQTIPGATPANGAIVGFEKKLWEADAEPFTATLREQQAEAARLDAAIEPFGSRIQTWLPFPSTLAP